MSSSQIVVGLDGCIEFDPVVMRAGVDEVGRGCLAGPVVAAAVIFKHGKNLRQFRDSKLLSEVRREELSLHIQEEHHWAIGIADIAEIDSLNILWASQLAMIRALAGLQEKLGCPLNHVYVDGHMKIRDWSACEQTAIIKGDAKVRAIAAASIVAKVYRDRLMMELAKAFPQYGFESHKGYPAPKHREAIRAFGPTEYHRRSFKGVAEFLGQSKAEVRS